MTHLLFKKDLCGGRIGPTVKCRTFFFSTFFVFPLCVVFFIKHTNPDVLCQEYSANKGERKNRRAASTVQGRAEAVPGGMFAGSQLTEQTGMGS